MDGQASISAEILARYAADAASEVEGVRALAGRRGVKIERRRRRGVGSSCTSSSTGAPRCRDVGQTVQAAGARVSRAHGGRRSGARRRRRRRGRARVVTKIAGLTGATLETAPTVCHECIFWQSRTGRSVDKRRWIRGTEEEWGAWGTVYYDDDGRLLGSMQYGPSDLFPRAAELPAGPPSRGRRARDVRVPRRPVEAVGDAVALPGGDRRVARQGRTCARGVRLRLRRRGVGARALPRAQDDLPARLPRRLRLRHARAGAGASSSSRLELGGLVPVVEGKRERVLRVVRDAFIPAPAPQRP